MAPAFAGSYVAFAASWLVVRLFGQLLTLGLLFSLETRVEGKQAGHRSSGRTNGRRAYVTTLVTATVSRPSFRPAAARSCKCSSHFLPSSECPSPSSSSPLQDPTLFPFQSVPYLLRASAKRLYRRRGPYVICGAT